MALGGGGGGGDGGGGFPTTHYCCCVVGSSKRNKVRNILRVNYIFLDQFIVFGAKRRWNYR